MKLHILRKLIIIHSFRIIYYVTLKFPPVWEFRIATTYVRTNILHDRKSKSTRMATSSGMTIIPRVMKFLRPVSSLPEEHSLSFLVI
jgi:hypothetical protein